MSVAGGITQTLFDAGTLPHRTRAASASLDPARRQYQLGGIHYRTLLNAQRRWQQARISLVQAEANRHADTAALFRALGGGGWHRGDVDPAQVAENAKQS